MKTSHDTLKKYICLFLEYNEGYLELVFGGNSQSFVNSNYFQSTSALHKIRKWVSLEKKLPHVNVTFNVFMDTMFNQ